LDGYLLDTNILSYWFDEGRPEHSAVKRYIDQLPEAAPLWVSAITLGEIEYGHRCSATPGVDSQKEFLAFVEKEAPYIADIDKHTATHYGELRSLLFKTFGPKSRRHRRPEELTDPTTAKQLGIQENDIWIAAQALQFGLVLLSNDKMQHLKHVVSDLIFVDPTITE
jgi:tRNA(fMet)-specific endonuclease VapC